MGKYSDNLFRRDRVKPAPSTGGPTANLTYGAPRGGRTAPIQVVASSLAEYADDRADYAIVVEPHPSKYPRHEGSKGSVHGGICNRTACASPRAIYYNIGTHGYYCYSCAKGINYDPRKAPLCVQVNHDLTHDEMNDLSSSFKW